MHRITILQLLAAAISLDLILLGIGGLLSAPKTVGQSNDNSSYSTDSVAATYGNNGEQRAPAFSGMQQNTEFVPPFERDASRPAIDADAKMQMRPETRSQQVATQMQPLATPPNISVAGYNTYQASDLQQADSRSAGSGAVETIQSQQTGKATAGQSGEAAPVPLAFTDPSGLNLSEDQRQQLASLQQNFVNAIGGENQDPSDPAYYDRWMTATEQSNILFKLEFGIQAFLVQQMNANRAGD
jgi:hypothetical protein